MASDSGSDSKSRRVRRVGVIGYELEGKRSGVGRYLEGLLGGVLDTEDDREWLVFCRGERFEHPLFERVGRGGARVVPLFDDHPGARPIAWEQVRLPFLLRRHRVDAVFSPGYSLPEWPRVPKVVTLHDLSFEHRPEEFRPRERWRRRLLARRAANTAARVLADTTAGARDLEATYGLDPSKIGVVPLAVDPRFFDPRSSDSPDESPYLLVLGSILPRRRVDLAISAFARVARDRPDLRLVIAGRDRLPEPGRLDGWIRASGVADRVERLDYAEEATLPALYAGAEATLYLSSYEGYGLPPLESLAAGTPALVGPGQALDDLWPDYPFRVEPSVEAVAGALDRLLDLDASARSLLVEEGRRRLRELDAATCARRFLDELAVALGEPVEKESA